MPADFQAYVQACLSDEQVAACARRPDEVYRDNIWHRGGAMSSEGWYHSHKLVRDARGRLKHVAGAVRTPIASAPWLIIIYQRTGQEDLIPDLLMTLSHYTVDATTLPHLTRELVGDEHTAFETGIADVLERIWPDAVEAMPLALPQTRDVGGSIPQVCRDTYLQQITHVSEALRGRRWSQSDDLKRSIVARCMAFTMAVWSELARDIAALPAYRPHHPASAVAAMEQAHTSTADGS